MQLFSPRHGNGGTKMHAAHPLISYANENHIPALRQVRRALRRAPSGHCGGHPRLEAVGAYDRLRFFLGGVGAAHSRRRIIAR